MKKVLILGGTSYDEIIYLDRLPDPVPATLFASGIEAVGSTGAGKALAMTKLGIDNRLHSILGNDEPGNRIIAFLESKNVRFTYDWDVQTERHVNLMDREGKRISIFVKSSTADLPLDLPRLETMIKDADLIVLNIIGYTKRLIPLIQKYHKEVWTDLHDYQGGDLYYQPFIDAADVIFLSSDRLPDYLHWMTKWTREGKKFVVTTHGRNGATLLEKNKEPRFEPIIESYPLVDANGAGDSFFSGFLYGYLKNQPMEKCLCYGTIAGGVKITSHQLVSEQLSSEYLESMYEKIY
ncbi:MAG TPA: carbohydrate kinase family protein [Candidatus Izemoplasmatales bacterium]|nr:carbohydrate kinase family protein [Candidatus Izemoplasmatales bacterium]